ncbi:MULTISPECIES: PBSX family phage terminase large subunit [Paenibacillus]|uniref:PBSX family phage terminase large subunit n=1 Tax=Paenibacillus TaxID=44249 RepID=UPI0016424FFD|nr:MULTISPECIES: PBSX family phage terminase large subunit [Paenibacillus]MCM3494548.1 PBSX family phage terminase large subunit [Paenibacillus lactis]
MAKRRKKTTSFKFKPFSRKQKKLLMWWTDNSPYRDYDMVVAEGAIRSGKTIAMIDSFITWSLDKHRDQNFIIAGKSMGALKRNVLEPMFQILTAKGIDYHYHRSENPHVVIGTNTYYLFGANNESSQDVLQGLTAAGAYLDEVALFPQSFVDQAIGRCSAETDGNSAKIFFNCNPGGPYHWFKLEYIDKAKEKKIYVLHFSMEDNLSLSQKVKERFYRMFSGVFFKRYILGLWVMAEGVIYDMFDRDKHVVPAEDRPYTQYYVSCDYGTQNPTTFGLWGLSRGVWYKVKEYHYDGRASSRQKTDEEYCDDLIEFVGDLKLQGVIVDPSAASFIAALKKRRRFRVVQAVNDVIDGIRNVASALSEGLIKYNDCCTETFREFSSYVWDEKAAARGEDKPLKENDHQMDGDRYFVNTVVKRKNGISILK